MGSLTMDQMRMKEIKTEAELQAVLDLCYGVLGERTGEPYGYEAWLSRLHDGLQPLVYAEKDGRVVSAVLGRAENSENLVIGFAACDAAFRGQGITRRLMGYFEEIARQMGFRSIALGSQADGFYEKCGYQKIREVHGQSVFQKKL